MVTSCVLDPNQHRFLTDHAIDGVPYHPGVMAMEMFAQAALLLMPGTCLVGMEAVTFGLPVKFLSESMTVRIVAEVEVRRVRTTGSVVTWNPISPIPRVSPCPNHAFIMRRSCD